MNRAKIKFVSAITMEMTKSVIVVVPVKACNRKPFS
jgi:hypothetical protein